MVHYSSTSIFSFLQEEEELILSLWQLPYDLIHIVHGGRFFSRCVHYTLDCGGVAFIVHAQLEVTTFYYI